MKRFFAILLALGALATICHGKPRWCSVSKRDPSNTITYPPIAVAAQVQGEARVRIIYQPNGKVEKVEPISGVAMLSQPFESQLMNWTVKTNEAGGELCQTLVVAVFTLRLPARARPSRQKVQFTREPNAVRVSISRNHPEIEESDSVQTARN
jgi:hypothetical protein